METKLCRQLSQLIIKGKRERNDVWVQCQFSGLRVQRHPLKCNLKKIKVEGKEKEGTCARRMGHLAQKFSEQGPMLTVSRPHESQSKSFSCCAENNGNICCTVTSSPRNIRKKLAHNNQGDLLSCTGPLVLIQKSEDRPDSSSSSNNSNPREQVMVTPKDSAKV